MPSVKPRSRDLEAAQRVAALLAGACMFLWQGLAAAGAPVTIAISPTPLSAPFYVAQAEGFFEDEGVEVSIVDTVGGFRCLQAVLDGEVLLGTTTEAPVMYRSFERDDFGIVATFVTTSKDVKLVARGDVTRVEDLVGRRVGTVRAANSQYFLDTSLLVHGIDPAQVDTVSLAPEQLVEALREGSVDAISAWEPFAWQALQAMNGAGRVLEGPEIYTTTFNLVALRDTARARGDDVKRVLRALASAIAHIAQHPAETQALLRARLDLDAPFLDWVWQDFHFELSLSQSLVVTMEGQARWAAYAGFVPAGAARDMPDYPGFFLADPLRDVEPRAIGLLR